MHAVAAVFASIIAFVSGFFAPTVASNSPVNVRTTQPAAAAVAQTEITGDPFNDPAAASAVVAASAAAPEPVPVPPPVQTVINQPVIERIIERIVPQGAATVSTQTLAAILVDFERSITARLAAFNPPPAAIAAQVAAGGNSAGYYFAPASQRIDQITNTAINTPTITGGTISGASVSGYLPLSGGTLTGALTGTDMNLSGVLTAGTLNVGGLSSSGALFAPYFNATSTTATSTFAGGFTIGGSQFVVQQGSGFVGIGTTNPSRGFSMSSSTALTWEDSPGVPGIIMQPGTGGALVMNRELRMDGSGTGALFGCRNTSASANCIATDVPADTSNRFTAAVDGTMWWGAGYTGQDTQLRRSATSTLQTNGAFQLSNALTVFGSSPQILAPSALNGLNVQLDSGSGQLNLSRTTGTQYMMLGVDSNSNGRISSFRSDSPFINWLLLNPDGGFVGINTGTDTLLRPLTVEGAGGLSVGTSQTAAGIAIQTTGSVGEVKGVKNNGSAFNALQLSTGVNPTMYLDTSGNVGIGTSSPIAQLHTTGTVRFSNFGAGTLTTDASGNVSVSSDERLKNIDAPFTRGLADIVKLSPIQYHWNATSGLDTGTQYAGFSAQNVQQAIPEAVGSSTSGYLTLQDRPLIAALVNAIKEIASIGGAFKSNLIAWLGEAGNGIDSIFAKDIYATNGTFDTITAHRVRSDVLCAGSICVTEAQLAALLATAGQSVGPSPLSVPPGTPRAPVIEINGNATSTISIGEMYLDLGARIIAPDSDLNLGIVILLDGATTTAVSIDTSAPGEHTILYTVTSPTSGLTSSAIRTVIISRSAQMPTPANDNPFNAAPANDNASLTTEAIGL